ncbi:leukocyte surface antigen CD53 isoform X2 [Myxocyprinus asiaticus]|uniref:leukocyte surface antigen CD53 isoform X2 n=1 Tax=Myxocyprinus asiaticus TaxID=70543 RepID=UPI002222655C|nr:leukocyte surface antigen CD53 isoform X2 [Myxocyprinus asiaticus]
MMCYIHMSRQRSKFEICGAAVFALGIYLMTSSRFTSLLPSLQSLNIANTLFITGIIISCVSFLGFLGALKENRCLLISFFILLFILMLAELAAACLLLMYEKQIDQFIKDDLTGSLKKYKEKNVTHTNDWDTVQKRLKCCGIESYKDWEHHVPQSCCKSDHCLKNGTQYWDQGCYNKLKDVFDSNLLNTGIAVIVVCLIEVLGMCFSMTLFCHISRSGLGYK